MIHQVGAGVVEDPLEHGGSNQRIGDDGPGIVKMRGNEALQIDRMIGVGNGEENDVFRTRCRLQHAIQYRLEQDQTECFEKSDGGKQQNAGKQLQKKREHVTHEARQLPHGAPARSGAQSPAAGRMGMRCKALFYLRRGGSIDNRSQAPPDLYQLYFGLSRCTTFT
jgi:hypothetical protein